MRWCGFLCCYCSCLPCCKDKPTQQTSSDGVTDQTSSPSDPNSVAVTIPAESVISERQTSNVETTENDANETATQNSAENSGRGSTTGSSGTGMENSVPNSPESADRSDQPLLSGLTGNLPANRSHQPVVNGHIRNSSGVCDEPCETDRLLAESETGVQEFPQTGIPLQPTAPVQDDSHACHNGGNTSAG